MKRVIERLRKEPREVKSQVAFVSALVITVLIGIVWLTTLPARFSGVGGVSEKFDTAKQNLASLTEGVTSESPTNKLTAESTMEDKQAELQDRVDAMITNVQNKSTKDTEDQTVTTTPGSPTSTGQKVMIVTIPSASTTPSNED